ncbi:MAG TPA: serine--tRNA ligase, partial [Acetobacteraceae bacterium]|nr:serine--tRNA ligase [Acetobacteraceae bacterium]
MHDIRAVRADPATFDAALARRGLPPEAASLLALDAERRAALTRLQALQAERNAYARQVGEARRKGEDSAALEASAVTLRGQIEALEAKAEKRGEEIRTLLSTLPNVLDADVPEGPDERFNVVLAQHGTPRDPGFAPRQHFELGEALGMMDFAQAAKLAGSRFVVLRGAVARLERALGQFMIDLHTREHGYEETAVPFLVNDAAIFGVNNLAKFSEDLFRTTDGRWLIPTAEVPLTNLAAGEILP